MCLKKSIMDYFKIIFKNKSCEMSLETVGENTVIGTASMSYHHLLSFLKFRDTPHLYKNSD